MRNIIGQTKSAFKLREVMDDGKILIVNLSKGRLGLLNSQLLGMIFVMKFQAAAMSRANIPESQRKDFALYVDEFQNFSTDSFATILSEARKYHLSLIVANQFTTQLTEEIRDAVFGNTGTIVAFRVGQDEDAEALAKRMRPAFEPGDLLRMPNYNAGVRMLINGVPTQPFSMATLPPLGDPNPKLSGALKQLSAAKYGRPKALVEKEIFERLATKEVAPAAGARPFGAGAQPGGGASQYGTAGARSSAPPAFGGAAAPSEGRFGTGPQAASTPAPAGPTPTGTGSFLDEWMSKRESKGPLLRQNPWAAKTPAPANGQPQRPASPVQTGPVPSAQPAPVPSQAPASNDPMPASSQAPAALDLPAAVTPQSGTAAPHLDLHGHGSAAPHHHDTYADKAAADAAKLLEAKPIEAPVTAATPEAPKVEDKSAGEIPLLKEKKTPAEGDDTIFIDTDGTLHMR
jgi:hypothetical protein